jgi:predicted alpha/beta superfamily hydrolase
MLDETAERLIQADQIAPLIIVGIDHAGAQRVEEFTPSHDERRGQGGGADRYGRMVIEEIKPFIDAAYRTDPRSAMLGGSSLGGLVSLYLGLRHPDVFSALVAVSPSVWWDRRFIVSFVEHLPAPTGQRIWLDTGTDEGGTSLDDLRQLRAAFEARGWRRGHDFHYLEADGAGHSEAAWAARVEPILRWLMPPAASGPDPRRAP